MNTKELIRTEVFDLIKGEFDPEEALEIVNHMLQKKIHFHANRDFRSQIKEGVRDEFSLERIEQLKEIREELQNQINEAKIQGKNLSVHASITINPL